MASSTFAFTPLLLLLLLLLLPQAFSSDAATTSSKNRSSVSKAAASSSFVPSASFVSTLQSTLGQIKDVLSLLTSIPGVFDQRLSAAITDCVDLLDLSSDELSWALSSSSSTSRPSSASGGGTGDRRYDLHSWTSAALGNQDTCKEGLGGGLPASLIAAGLDTVTSLVSDALQEIAGASGGAGRRRLMGFPEWVSPGDRRLLQESSQQPPADAVVAQDGTGNYTTVSAAVEEAPDHSQRRYVIHVKKGVYKENVDIKKKKWNLMIIGDGVGQTIISGDRNYVDGWTTYRSATFAVTATGFIARDLTIENTAGPGKHQAVALRSDSDLSVYYRCEFAGYQDTLYAHSLRQFYRDCRVSGTVDFVFGNAAAVFQNCELAARRPLANQKNSVTAQGRADPNQNTGFSFQFCNVTGEAELTDATATYLGRPWKEYSRTVFMKSYLGPVLRPEGWLEWDRDFALDTLYYAEYLNYGPGSNLTRRVKWAGFHVLSDPVMVVNFTVAQFLDGNLWLPATGVKYTAGLSL
ncbi:pectinesterase-like [Curcuma longa]|uniref:pectinesterase-like n=1 Tax=Curcuma longa TaxID=136217 RepID=UPI003D9F285C